jgi:hypothetical protein
MVVNVHLTKPRFGFLHLDSILEGRRAEVEGFAWPQGGGRLGSRGAAEGGGDAALFHGAETGRNKNMEEQEER